MDDFQTLVVTLQSWYTLQPLLTIGVYFLAFTVLAASGLPGASVLLLAGGACMGLGWGTLVANLASSLGALLTLWMSRYLVNNGLSINHHERLITFNRMFEANQVAALLSLRLAPVIPYPVMNWLSGLMPVKSWTFFWTSFVGMLPGTWLYVNVGRQSANLRSLNDVLTVDMLAALGALACVPWVVQRVAKRIGLWAEVT